MRFVAKPLPEEVVHGAGASPFRCARLIRYMPPERGQMNLPPDRQKLWRASRSSGLNGEVTDGEAVYEGKTARMLVNGQQRAALTLLPRESQARTVPWTGAPQRLV
jgi:hypothetical protein